MHGVYCTRVGYVLKKMEMANCVDWIPRWDKETYDAAKKEQDVDRIARVRGVGGTVPRKDRSIIAEQARILLEGKESWRPGWKDYGLAKGPERGFQ